MSRNQKAQSWSIDITFGVIVFMAAFFVFFAVLSEDPNAKISRLKEDASIIIRQIVSGDSSLRIVDGTEVNESKASKLKEMNYEELKRRFRVENDFCIYIEDSKGNIVLINDSYKGIGSPQINISGTLCSQK